MTTTTDPFATITAAHLTTVAGGANPFQQLVADNARKTAERFDLVQRGQLDREDFNFFLQNQTRAASVLAHSSR